ncbi:hypothetical protein [Brevibacillus parabrevis]|uniref:hypothetical protein n=1 Tax=Brevibacillus parabrevis TaxID=54914 RepID=UPI002E2299AA|nr:hypothetical protein [Brevibacillus parabrevis]
MTQLSHEALEARRKHEREYKKKWRQKPENKQKEKEYRQKYWERKAKEVSSNTITNEKGAETCCG